MKLIKHFKQSPDLLLALIPGAVALLLSYIPQLTIARWIFGFTFVFLSSGYCLTRFLPISSSIVERIVASGLISLLLTYPASVLTVLLEGQSSEAIFGNHLTTSLSSLFLISLSLTIFVSQKPIIKINSIKFPKLLVIPVIIYVILSFTNLNRGDVFADEYDLGYQAYNLVDGIVAGRKGLFISLSQHPPLAINIKHYSMNILEPSGLDNLQDWQFRVSESLIGILSILVIYLLGEEFYSKKVGLIASVLLAANNYMVWMGRTFHREMYLTFFMSTAIYFYIKVRRNQVNVFTLLAGIALGASLLVKETGLIIVAIPLIDLIINPKSKKPAKKVLTIAFLIFLPVILYNFIAYLSTGYADVFFSNLFGVPHPLTTPRESTPIRNGFSLISYLFDIYSPLISLSFIFGLLYGVWKKAINHTILLWLLVSIVFFSLTTIRAYYFLFLTIPLTLIVSEIISRMNKKLAIISFSALLVYSLVYSVNTNIIRSYTHAQDIGGIDGSIIVKHPLYTHYSIAARSWVEEVGYKRLQEILDKRIRNTDCLITSLSVNQLAARRYLGHKDTVKEFYLGIDYPSRYPKCPTNPQSIVGNIYFLSEKNEKIGSLELIITDHLGNERFYLFILEKGTYS